MNIGDLKLAENAAREPHILVAFPSSQMIGKKKNLNVSVSLVSLYKRAASRGSFRHPRIFYHSMYTSVQMETIDLIMNIMERTFIVLKILVHCNWKKIL